MKGTVIRFDAGALVDATGFFASPGSILVDLPAQSADATGVARLPSLLASGDPSDVRRHPAAPDARVVNLPDHVILPGLVNAHTHLDLTHIGPRPHAPAGGFVPWVSMIRQRRLDDPVQIAASVRRGIALSLAGGTVAVGDIAGAPRGKPSLEPFRTLRHSPLLGTSFLEFFSRGTFREQGLQAGLDAMTAGLGEYASLAPESRGLHRLGLQPHAPNTVERASFERASRAALLSGAPLCTHLAETPEEARFIARGDGPQKDMLVELGLWDDAASADLALGLHPVEHLAEVLAQARYLVAHVNHADDRAIEILSRTRTSVAYCPRASSYFHAEASFGPHRYREMLDAGIAVALGTDSIVNLPAGSDDPHLGRLSILDEMRWLFRRDGADPLLLLRMATVNGAEALGLEPDLFMLEATGDAKPIAGLIAVRAIGGSKRNAAALAEVLRSDAPPELLLCSKDSTFAATSIPRPLHGYSLF